MYKVYRGGRAEPQRVEEAPERGSRPPLPPRPQTPRPEGFADPIRQTVESVLGRITGELDTEDLILLAVLYLLYRESGDVEMLFIMGALLLL